ncbi:TetR/AcrR family transcriptional regulator [Saxibacter everestensis]|uniref:TetR/AcrR family transcriptional regulator n=1 Tax=Saxibacter everestensis TaxID=2909229 RepID=A0ABY8QY24_9MICO|nr:TetR/AcrR family transcriptional regulator [Brevibacteriaceae bacterium ZFBP1038]
MTTREKIYESAVVLIAEHGYAATTIDEIAAKAEVAKGTVYYNFGSKEELFRQLLGYGVDLLTSRMTEVSKGLKGTAALDAIFTEVLQRASKTPAFMQLLFTEMYRTGRAWQDTLLFVRENVLGVIRNVIAEGKESGEFDPSVDPETASAAAMGALAIAILDWLAYHPSTPVDELHKSVSQLLLRGLVG